MPQIEKLENLEKFLPTGYALIIADETGFSPNYIYMIKAGKRENLLIVSKMIKMAQAEKKKIEKLNNKIETL